MKKKYFIISTIFLILYVANIKESRAQWAVLDQTLVTADQVTKLTTMWTNIKTFLHRIEAASNWVSERKAEYESAVDRAMMIYQNAQMIKHTIYNLDVMGNPLDLVSDLLALMGSMEDTRADTLDLYEDSKEYIPYAAIDDTYGAFKEGKWVPPVDPLAMNRKYDTLEIAIRDYQKKAKRINISINTNKTERERQVLELKKADTVAKREAARAKIEYHTKNWQLFLAELEDVRSHLDIIEQRRENLDKKVRENVVNQAMVFHYRNIKNSSTRLMSGGGGNSSEIANDMVL